MLEAGDREDALKALKKPVAGIPVITTSCRGLKDPSASHPLSP